MKFDNSIRNTELGLQLVGNLMCFIILAPLLIPMYIVGWIARNLFGLEFPPEEDGW